MGLDAWAVTRNSENEESEFASWRKHNALQGWMENVWREQGNTGNFNCQYLQLDDELLDRLENDVFANKLPETKGFFFGDDSRHDDFQKEKTLKFIVDARVAIGDGQQVFYRSWW
jgi:hypothetical protein